MPPGLLFPHYLFGSKPAAPLVLYSVVFSRKAIGLLLPGMMALPGRVLMEPDGLATAIAELFTLDPNAKDPSAYRWFLENFLTAHYRTQLAGFLQTAETTVRGFHKPNPDLQSALLRYLEAVKLVVRVHVPPLQAWSMADPLSRDTQGTCTEDVALFDLRPALGDPPAADASLALDPSVSKLASKYVMISATDRSPEYLEMNVGTGELIRDFVGNSDAVARYRARVTTGTALRVFLLTEQDVFESCLIRLPEDRTANAERNLLGGRYLLPVTPLALALFGAEQLAEALSVEEVGREADGSRPVKVTLKLSFAGAELGLLANPFVTIQKNYWTENGTLLDAAAPDAFALWPDFIVEGTAADMPTLAFQATSTKTADGPPQIRAKDLLSRPDLVARLEAATRNVKWPLGLAGVGQYPGRAKPIIEPSATAHEMLHTRTSGEAIQFAAGPGARGLFLRHTSAWGRRVEDRQTGIVGIDFGTSSTTVAFRLGNGDPTNLLFPHVANPFRISDNPNDSDYLNASRFFLPPAASLPTPFPSVLQLRTRYSDNDETPVLRARIPFPNSNNPQQLQEMIRNWPPDTVMECNLKWADEDERGKVVEQLLYCVLLLAFGHARDLQLASGDIEWRFTLPKVMSGKKRSRFKEDARAALRRLLGSNMNPAKALFFWESASVHAFIRWNREVAPKPFMATVDIGGRSTDICISSGGRLLADGSANFAGRAMLVNLWADRWAEYEALVKDVLESSTRAAQNGKTAQPVQPPSQPAGRPNIVEEKRRDAQVALVELQLGQPNFDLEHYVKDAVRVEKNALLKSTALRIQFSYLALIYFLIFHGLDPIIEQGNLPEETKALLKISPGLAVFLGGRGSRLISLFCQNKDRSGLAFGVEVEQWLARIGLQGATYEVATTREKAKQEVALGCLQLRADDGAATATDDGLEGGNRHVFPEAPPAQIMHAAEGPAPFGDPTATLWNGKGTFEAFCKDLVAQNTLGDHAKPVLTQRRIDESRQAAADGMSQPDVEAYVGFKGFDEVRPHDPLKCPRRRFLLQLNAFLDLWDKPGRLA